MKDYYQFFGLPRSCQTDEITSRYKILARKFHPDKNNDKIWADRQFKLLQEAYETLKDKTRRKTYDADHPEAGLTSQGQHRPASGDNRANTRPNSGYSFTHSETPRSFNVRPNMSSTGQPTSSHHRPGAPPRPSASSSRQSTGASFNRHDSSDARNRPDAAPRPSAFRQSTGASFTTQDSSDAWTRSGTAPRPSSSRQSTGTSFYTQDSSDARNRPDAAPRPSASTPRQSPGTSFYTQDSSNSYRPSSFYAAKGTNVPSGKTSGVGPRSPPSSSSRPEAQTSAGSHTRQNGVFKKSGSQDDPCDLRKPETWYKGARRTRRNIIYHWGPPNSRKTYQAIKEFKKAASGVYCCPLRLLAAEVADKCNTATPPTPCDMITGEEVRLVDPRGGFADHVATTIQMADMDHDVHIAIIDEIQMIGESQNGWAFTRALLGLRAPIIHVCGDKSALNLVKHLVESVGDQFDDQMHIRPNRILSVQPVLTVNQIRKGDCVVSFRKSDIFKVAKEISKLDLGPPAIIYGSLPPETKHRQAELFNDPNDPHKILVATDAVGMGMNLKNIDRIIFYQMQKYTKTKDGEGMRNLTASQTVQIAGRAGRGERAADGYVTTFHKVDYPLLEELLESNLEPVEQAGLRPPLEKILEFATRMQGQNQSLVRLIELYVANIKYDNSLYFLGSIESITFCAGLIEHLQIELADMYTFCTAPLNKKSPLYKRVYVGMAEEYSQKKNIRADWLCTVINWSQFETGSSSVKDLPIYEEICNILDLYIWLRNKFKDFFPDLHVITGLRRHIIAKIDSAIDDLSKFQGEEIGFGGRGRSGGRGYRF